MTLLMAGMLSLGAAGFGFSRWSSDLNLNGNVTAKGSWDVQIENASLLRTSSFAEADAAETDVTVYPVYARTLSYSGGEVYRMQVDDQNPQTWSMSLDDLASFDRRNSLPGVNNIYSFYATNIRGCTIFYNMQLTDLGRSLGFDHNVITDVPNTDGGIHDGELVAYAIGRSKADGRNSWKIDLCYNEKVEELEDRREVEDARVDVTVYPIYAGALSYSGGEVYRWKIDNANKQTMSLSLAELEEYTREVSIPGQNNIYNFYTEGKGNGCSIWFRMKLTPEAVALGFDHNVTSEVPNTDNGASDGVFLGYGIGLMKGTGNNRWNISLEYNDAVEAVSNAEGEVHHLATISEDGQSAEFNAAHMDLPGAWAEYSITLVNNGTANANLTDYTFSIDGSDQFDVNIPALPADEVLKPGETCTVTFTVQVKNDADEVLDENGELNVHLHYEQDAVEAAPEASHTHK